MNQCDALGYGAASGRLPVVDGRIERRVVNTIVEICEYRHWC
jgi:hypothetical protein